MKLFVDDTRPFPASGFECCRDADTAIHLLSVMDFDFVSLDYSLGKGKTGLDILRWMKDHHKYVPHINIHSTHIDGKENMRVFCKENFPQSIITTNSLDKF